MKGCGFAVAGLGVGGAAYVGADSPDFAQTVKMSRSEVYSAFSAVAPEGTTTLPETAELGRKVTIRVTKEQGESIRYEVLFDDDPVVTADLGFAPEGDTQTQMTAELDINAYALGSTFQTEAGMALAMVPDSLIDAQFAEMMREMVQQVESGQSLRPVGMNQFGVRRHYGPGSDPSAGVEQRRYEAEMARRAAVAPSTSTAPMIDPSRAADDYLAGRPSQQQEAFNAAR